MRTCTDFDRWTGGRKTSARAFGLCGSAQLDVAAVLLSSLGSAPARNCSARGSSARASRLFPARVSARPRGLVCFSSAQLDTWLGSQLPAQLGSAHKLGHGARGLLALLSSAQLSSASAQHGTAICLATLSASPLTLPWRMFWFRGRGNKFGVLGGTKTEHISFAGKF